MANVLKSGASSKPANFSSGPFNVAFQTATDGKYYAMAPGKDSKFEDQIEVHVKKQNKAPKAQWKFQQLDNQTGIGGYGITPAADKNALRALEKNSDETDLVATGVYSVPVWIVTDLTRGNYTIKRAGTEEYWTFPVDDTTGPITVEEGLDDPENYTWVIE